MKERLNIAKGFLEDAKKELARYIESRKKRFLMQSAEKGWACVVQALKCVNPKIKTHREFGRTAVELSEKFKNEKIADGEAYGEMLHSAGFYEGNIDERMVEHSLVCIEEFLGQIEKILNGRR